MYLPQFVPKTRSKRGFLRGRYKNESTFFWNSRKRSKFEWIMPIYGQIWAFFSCFYRNFIQNLYPSKTKTKKHHLGYILGYIGDLRFSAETPTYTCMFLLYRTGSGENSYFICQSKFRSTRWNSKTLYLEWYISDIGTNIFIVKH